MSLGNKQEVRESENNSADVSVSRMEERHVGKMAEMLCEPLETLQMLIAKENWDIVIAEQGEQFLGFGFSVLSLTRRSAEIRGIYIQPVPNEREIKGLLIRGLKEQYSRIGDSCDNIYQFIPVEEGATIAAYAAVGFRRAELVKDDREGGMVGMHYIY